MRKPFIGVIGAGSCSSELEELAVEVGREIAKNNCVLVCGGLGGVMEAAARGTKQNGGASIGILPGPTTRDANPHIDFPIATNLGQARNAVIVQTADVFISIGGGWGTLSEMALATKIGKSVVALAPEFEIPSLRRAAGAKEAVAEAIALLPFHPGAPSPSPDHTKEKVA
jgi:hypothetical protein